MTAVLYNQIIDMSEDDFIIALATKVMGYKLVDEPDNSSRKKQIWIWKHPRTGWIKGEPYNLRKGLFSHSWHNWKPTKDIAQAWHVVERMERQGWSYNIYRHIDTDGNDNPVASFGRGKYDGYDQIYQHEFSYDSKNPADAICKAALYTLLAYNEVLAGL
jgi:hypothetical protein